MIRCTMDTPQTTSTIAETMATIVQSVLLFFFPAMRLTPSSDRRKDAPLSYATKQRARLLQKDPLFDHKSSF